MKKSNVIFEAIALLVIIACLLTMPAHGQLNCSGGCGTSVVTTILQGAKVTTTGSPIVMANVYSNGTIPANTITGGTKLRYEILFNAINNDGATARTAQFQFMFDSNATSIGCTNAAPTTLGLASLASSTNATEVWCTCEVTFEGSGTVTGNVACQKNVGGTITTAQPQAIASVDTTVSHTVNVQDDWGTAPASSSSLIVNSFLVQKFN